MPGGRGSGTAASGMAWQLRLWRRIRVAPGVSVNLSKCGPSVSVGPRGAKTTIGRRGIRRPIGIPGTGIYATDRSGTRHQQGVHGYRPPRVGRPGRSESPAPRSPGGGIVVLPAYAPLSPARSASALSVLGHARSRKIRERPSVQQTGRVGPQGG